MSLRALHVIPSLDLSDGGPSVALPQMARGLRENDVEVEIVTTLDPAFRPAGLMWGALVSHQGCNVRFFPRQTHFYKLSVPLQRWLQQHVSEYDVVHNHAIFSFAPLAGARAARQHHVPYLIRPLGLLNRWGMTQRRPWIKRLSFLLLDRPALNGAVAIHYTSVSEMEEASTLGLTSPSLVLPLGIDDSPFQTLTSPNHFYEACPRARGKRIVLFLSRITPKKGLDILLPAFAQIHAKFPETILVVAGNGEAEYVNSLKKRSCELGISSHILWPGFLVNEGKLAAFAAAEIFVLPSYSENFGIALLEAMMAGLPCIASDQVALVRDVPEAVATVPCDAVGLAAAMRNLLADSSLRKSLSHSARVIAKEHFSLQSTGQRLASFYRSSLPSFVHRRQDPSICDT